MHSWLTHGTKPAHPRAIRVIGDDISGTTEALAAALTYGHGNAPVDGLVHLHSAGSAWNAQDAAWHALDLDSRNVSPAEASNRYRAALTQLRESDSAVTMIKIDSLLRGNVAAAMAPNHPTTDRPVILAPALPAQGRSTLGGHVVLPTSAPQPGTLEGTHLDVVAAAGRSAEVIPLHEIRGDQRRLKELFAGLAARGSVCVCDAETDQDLESIAAAALTFEHPVLVGASGLAAPIGRHLAVGQPDGSGQQDHKVECQGDVSTQGKVLVVAGTAEASVAAQIDELIIRDVPVLEAVGTGTRDAVIQNLRSGTHHSALVLRAPAAPHDPHKSDEILQTMASVAYAAVADRPHIGLVLTGGATARAVLDRLDIVTLRLCCQLHPGAAHLVTTSGRNVIIRPGSHGDTDSLLEAVRHLDGLPHDSSLQTPLSTTLSNRKGSS